MIRHIVMWKFLDTAQGRVRLENVRRAELMLRELPSLIPAIRSFEVATNVGPDPDAYELVLNATFASLEELKVYQDHPDHQRVAGFLRGVRSARTVVDYEY
ncbi:MAG TPA: Dabb family protein [Bacteroidota bacterium]|nr:Dabb family protein [Bacteroidota bacterium]